MAVSGPGRQGELQQPSVEVLSGAECWMWRTAPPWGDEWNPEKRPCCCLAAHQICKAAAPGDAPLISSIINKQL